jgi:uncharacterized protein with ParB-like and HNH nuclease domain
LSWGVIKMEVKPDYLELGAVFSEVNLYKVPKFQRSYSWDGENVSQLCQDIELLYNAHEKDRDLPDHFLGGIVCVKVPNQSKLDTKAIYQLVDGQQRLTTLVLIVSRMIALLKDLKGIKDEAKLSATISSYRKKFIVYLAEAEGEEFDRLTLSRRDEVFFKKIVHKGDFDASKSDFNSHKLMEKAVRTIDKWLRKFTDSNNANHSLVNIDKLYNVIRVGCKVLVIRMSDVSDAYRLFQVMNDRGRSLTAGDLLRASSLGLVDEQDANEKELLELEKLWDEITIGGQKATDDRLISIYASRTSKRPKRSNLFDTYQNDYFSGKTKEEISKEVYRLGQDVARYNDLSEGVWPYKEPKCTAYQKNKLYNLIVKFKHTHSLPLLMAASSLSEKKFFHVIYLIEKFFFAYKLALKKSVSPITKCYTDTIQEINKSPNNFQPLKLADRLSRIIRNHVSDQEFLGYVNSLDYEKDNDRRALKFLLMTCEEAWSWKQMGFKGGVLGLAGNLDKNLPAEIEAYSLEHILPKSVVSPVEEMEDLKHSIWNLTLLFDVDNSKLGDDPYVNKRKMYSESRLNITKMVSKNEAWNLDAMKERRDLLELLIKRCFYFC